MFNFKTGDIVYSPQNRYTITSAKEYYVGLVIHVDEDEKSMYLMTLYSANSTSALSNFFLYPDKYKELIKNILQSLKEKDDSKRFKLFDKIESMSAVRYFKVRTHFFEIMTKETVTEAFDVMTKKQKETLSFIPHRKHGHNRGAIQKEFIEQLTYFFDTKRMQQMEHLPHIPFISW